VIASKAAGASAARRIEIRLNLSYAARRKAIVVALAATLALAAAGPAAGQSVNTVVSLAFDRGYANQGPARTLLTSHGMDATFYVNTGTIGQSGFMTWTQLQGLGADGNEVGGETINHTRLTQVTTEEARRQVCDDRSALVAHGFSPTSFAYPFSAYNATVQQIVRDCGYSSGRTVGSLADLCSGCPFAESIPPADAYAVRTPDSIKSATTLDTMKAYVTQAETHGGGWVVLVFNQVCNACATHSITQANLTAFLDWLQPRAATGTVVKTVGQVIQPPPTVPDTTPPTSSISCNTSPCSTSTYHGPVTVGLSAADDPGGSGVTATRYTTDGSDPTETSPAYAAPFTVSETTTVKFRSWDAAGNIETTKSQLIEISTQTQPTVVSITFDDGDANQAAARALLTSHGMDATFYVNSGTIGQSGKLTWAQLQQLRGDGNEIGGHTIDHARLTAVSPEEARRQVCDDRAALVGQGFSPTSFAYPESLYNSTVQQIVRDCGYSSARTVGFLADICSGCPYAESIPPLDAYAVRTPDSIENTTTLDTIKSYVTQAETHEGGWVVLVFHGICNACIKHAITEADLAAFLDWLEPRSANGTVVKTVGEVMGPPPPPPPPSDTTPPTSSITCNGSPCSTSWYAGNVTVALASVDEPGGSGVSATRFTTDGSEPTATSPVYTGPFAISETTTVKFRSWDLAGNVEATKSQDILVDAAPPTSSITCNGSSCSTSWYPGSVTVALASVDEADGSGVSATRYTTDGSEPTAASPVYPGPFVISGTTTVNFRSWDVAGNVEATKSQSIRIDTTAPTIALTSPSNGAAVKGTVPVTATASDADSGIARVDFYLDGTLLGTRAAPPYKVSWNTKKSTKGQHVLYAIAYDLAGNTWRTSDVLVTVG
jgi:peptidoglycan/xylan/chitin deacetylase (PgdA/CDA1 family)